MTLRPGINSGIDSDQPQPPPPSGEPQHLLDRTLKNQAAPVEHQQPVGIGLGLAQIVRRGQDRRALVASPPEELPQLRPRHRIDPTGRLVQDQGAGTADAGQGDVQAPLPPARQGADRRCHIVIQAELGDDLLNRPGIVVQARHGADGLTDLEPPRQARLLELNADDHPLLPRGPHLPAGDANLARGRQAQTGDHLHGRGLARAIGADEDDDLTGADREGDVVEGERIGTRIALGHPLPLHHVLRAGSSCSGGSGSSGRAALAPRRRRPPPRTASGQAFHNPNSSYLQMSLRFKLIQEGYLEKFEMQTHS